MASQENRFIPEAVDEQIDQLTYDPLWQSQQHRDDVRLIEILRRAYQPKPANTLEDQHSLQRVKQRIADRKRGNTIQHISARNERRTELQHLQGRYSSMDHTLQKIPAPSRFLPRGLSILAAVMILGLLLGSLLFVLHLTHREPVVSPKKVTPAPALTPPSVPTYIPTPPSPSTPLPAGLAPPERYGPTLAYDKKRGLLVLFGGAGPDGVPPSGALNNGEMNDTWTWDGKHWTKQHPSAFPAPRLGASMVYDPATDQIVLFGGWKGSNYFNDTWTWDGKTWTLQHPVNQPPVRGGASMAYDAATQSVVLFGGQGYVATATPPILLLNDTWTWDGNDWTKQHPKTVPSERGGAGMVFDAAIGSLVMYGGFVYNGSPEDNLGYMWTWDGKNWTQQHPASFPATTFTSGGRAMSVTSKLNNDAISYDEASGLIVLTLYGNDNTGTHEGLATWAWNGTTWTQKATQSFDKDLIETMVYDSAHQRLLAFSSQDLDQKHLNYVDKLWAWDGQQWQELLVWGSRKAS